MNMRFSKSTLSHSGDSPPSACMRNDVRKACYPKTAPNSAPTLMRVTDSAMCDVELPCFNSEKAGWIWALGHFCKAGPCARAFPQIPATLDLRCNAMQV